MGKSKMDEAAAARIRKARGEKVSRPGLASIATPHARRRRGLTRMETQDEFARRAAMAARTNKEGETSKEGQQGGGNGPKQGETKK